MPLISSLKKGVPPTFKVKLQNQTVTDTKLVKITCTINGDPLPNVIFFFNNVEIKQGRRYKINLEKNGQATLEIKDFNAENVGSYVCKSVNTHGEVQCKCDVTLGGTAQKPNSSTQESASKEPIKVATPDQPKEAVLAQNTNQTETTSNQNISPKKSPSEDESLTKVAAPKVAPLVIPTTPTSTSTPTKIEPLSPKSPTLNRIYNPMAKNGRQVSQYCRNNIKEENPTLYYDFGEEIGRGKFSIVKYCTKKDTKEQFAAKIIKYDYDIIKIAMREYDLMSSGKLNNKGLVKLNDTYIVQKYLILICDLVAGDTLLTHVSKRSSFTEDDAANIIRQLLEILLDLHSNNVVHLDIRPTNIRLVSNSSREIRLVDYNSSRSIANKMAGEVVDVIGDTEFCAPEMLKFEPVSPYTDIWSVGVIAYILLSGISPFYDPDEDEVLANVESVKWHFDGKAFAQVSIEARDFIKKCFIRVPEMRMTTADALKHKWLDPDLAYSRKNTVIDISKMDSTDKRLLEEEEEEYIYCSTVMRAFNEPTYDSPESEEE